MNTIRVVEMNDTNGGVVEMNGKVRGEEWTSFRDERGDKRTSYRDERENDEYEDGLYGREEGD